MKPVISLSNLQILHREWWYYELLEAMLLRIKFQVSLRKVFKSYKNSNFSSWFQAHDIVTCNCHDSADKTISGIYLGEMWNRYFIIGAVLLNRIFHWDKYLMSLSGSCQAFFQWCSCTYNIYSVNMVETFLAQ